MVNLHIIGMQKAGTTALASFLNQHPAVYVVDGKEAHVFDHPNFDKRQNQAQFAENKYNEKLKHYHQQKIICDATPITIFQEDFLQACYRYNPNAKFVVILRDPVQRAISHYNMCKARGLEKHSMLTAFLLEKLRLSKSQKEQNWDFDSPLRNHTYLSRGLYTKQLRSLYKLVPREQILVLNQEELKHKHKQVMHKLFLFLDIHKHEIQAKTVFETQSPKAHWTDPLAKCYAKLYYLAHAETPGNWQKITK